MGPWSVLQPHLTAWPVEVPRPQMTSRPMRLSQVPSRDAPVRLPPLPHAPPLSSCTGSLPWGLQNRRDPGTAPAPSLEHLQALCTSALSCSGRAPWRESGKRGGSRQLLNTEGSHYRAGLAGRLDAGSETAVPEQPAPSVEWFRRMGCAGSVHFHWCVAVTSGSSPLLVPGSLALSHPPKAACPP